MGATLLLHGSLKCRADDRPLHMSSKGLSLKNRCCCEFCEWSLSARRCCLPACCLTHTGGIHQNNETLCGSVLTAALRYRSNTLQNIHRSGLLNHMLSLSQQRSGAGAAVKKLMYTSCCCYVPILSKKGFLLSCSVNALLNADLNMSLIPLKHLKGLFLL